MFFVAQRRSSSYQNSAIAEAERKKISFLPLSQPLCRCLSLNLSAAVSAENSVRSSGIMSRRWIQNPNRCSDEYLDGIEDFIEFARRQNPGATRIRCPCRRCNNTLWETIENVGFHLVRNRIIETYSIWNLHGEQLDHASSSNATRMDSVEPIADPNDQVMDII
ncbi:hypothetical protein L3X38_002994 [Prunus dulcis]|uniref:Transposase-associated domain-containing protein n=1 Tax=Prunus dulcis TaxID=3755 RepID=A0AAD4WV02_PRUDU|nr:hypothetical protein L3X38_002994 [Prunus dulcis]